jgi:hypothetical protein
MYRNLDIYNIFADGLLYNSLILHLGKDRPVGRI